MKWDSFARASFVSKCRLILIIRDPGCGILRPDSRKTLRKKTHSRKI